MEFNIIMQALVKDIAEQLRPMVADMARQELAESNHRAAQAMESIGGGFAAALALAYFRADGDNRARILAAFPDLFEKYRRIAVELRELRELAD